MLLEIYRKGWRGARRESKYRDKVARERYKIYIRKNCGYIHGKVSRRSNRVAWWRFAHCWLRGILRGLSPTGVLARPPSVNAQTLVSLAFSLQRKPTFVHRTAIYPSIPFFRISLYSNLLVSIDPLCFPAFQSFNVSFKCFTETENSLKINRVREKGRNRFFANWNFSCFLPSSFLPNAFQRVSLTCRMLSFSSSSPTFHLIQNSSINRSMIYHVYREHRSIRTRFPHPQAEIDCS